MEKTKWEYNTYKLKLIYSSTLNDNLNEQGLDGWELVNITFTENEQIAYLIFKRLA